MAYFEITVNTPYCGTRMEEYVKCETLSEAEAIAEELCQQNAENYEYLMTGWDYDAFDTEKERDEALENYYAECHWYVEEITEEEYLENIP